VEITLCTTQGEKKITGDTNVRRQLGKNGQTLRSSFFALEKVPAEDNATEYLLRGGGWGHRVGVCQWGMEGMARQGASASEILSHFLPGTEIITCQ
jgi:SpoIID/LytB domain protein